MQLELTLTAIQAALRDDTIARLPVGALSAPLATALEQCDNQLFAVLVRDLEDYANPRGAVGETNLRAALNAIIAAGEQRLGRGTFWALISEYE